MICFAASQADTYIQNILDSIVNPIVKVMITVALVIFLWGVVEFIMGADNEEKRDAGKKHIIWGVIGLFIMVAVFGIMNLLSNFWHSV